jgi:hypothetical protein
VLEISRRRRRLNRNSSLRVAILREVIRQVILLLLNRVGRQIQVALIGGASVRTKVLAPSQILGEGVHSFSLNTALVVKY